MDHTTAKEKLVVVKKDKLLLSIVGLVVLALMGFISYKYFTPEWKSYQSEFRDLVEE